MNKAIVRFQMHLIPLSLNGGVTNGEYIEALSKNGMNPIWENSWSKGNIALTKKRLVSMKNS